MLKVVFSVLWLCAIPLLANETEFNMLYNKFLPTCSNQRVARLSDGSDYLKTKIPWSLSSSTIHDFVRGNNSPYCTNVDQLMEAVTHPVTKYPCRVKWLSLEEICTMIESHSFFVWSGDSLMRHMIQALLVLLKQDLEYGGYPPHAKGETMPYEKCQCDGQFSESRVCRDYVKYNYNEFFSFTNVSKHSSACSSFQSRFTSTQRPVEFVSDTINSRVILLKERNFFTRPSVEAASIAVTGSTNVTSSIDNSTSSSKHHRVCSTDRRPVFFLLQGGAHYSTDPKEFIETYLQPYLHNIHATAAQCNETEQMTYKINIVVSGVITCAPKVVEQFQHQSNERAAKFYAAVSNFLAVNYPHVRLLNLLSLTSEGINRSDGFHSFSDINLIKTMIVLNAMNMML